jgi:hypothetical protein
VRHFVSILDPYTLRSRPFATTSSTPHGQAALSRLLPSQRLPVCALDWITAMGDCGEFPRRHAARSQKIRRSSSPTRAPLDSYDWIRFDQTLHHCHNSCQAIKKDTWHNVALSHRPAVAGS